VSGRNWLLIPMISLLVVLPAAGCDSGAGTSPGNLQFNIQDESENPLWGAKVVSESQPDGQLKVTGITGLNGTVIFNNIAAGEYRFYISRFDYFPTEAALTVIAGQTRVIDINLSAETNPATIPTTVPEITFGDLTNQPEMHTGQFVNIEGYWFDGFEIAVLAERLEPSGFALGNVEPGGIKIWIKGGLPEEISRQLHLQANNPTGYPAHYGKVRLNGKLEWGGKYGHLNSYEFQLQVYDSELLPWEPAPV